MKEYIVINGTGGSGKDTFVSLCAKYAKVYNFSSIDKVKEVARLIDWNDEKDERSRKFLSDLKALTNEYNDTPFKDMLDKAEMFRKSDSEIMFIHIREPENIKRACDTLNAKTLLIKRKGLENIKTNYSDRSVDNYDYDEIIFNDTLENLEISAKKYIEKLREKNNS